MMKAVIFDMDGVIIDTELFFIKSKNQLLKKYGHEIPEGEEFRFHGRSHKYMWETLKKEHDLKESVSNLELEANNLRRQMIQEDGLKPIPGVLNLIHHLKRQDILLAIASSSSLKDIQQTISVFKLEETFDYVISGESVKETKPEPDIFLKTAKILNVKPKNCLVIEDSENGVLAAKNAGMKVIGFHNENYPPQNLSNATKIITDFDALNKQKCEEIFFKES